MKPNNFPLRPSLDGSEELYTQTNGVSEKFTLNTTKSFITEPTDITYSELYDKVINEELTPFQWYRLTDYRNVNFLNGWEIANNNPTPTDPNFNPQEIFTGETEILLLQAITPSELSPVAYSETFPQDIITYQAYTNKLGVDIGGISNGDTLPDSSTVSGFDLQWDGTNVYFDMPTGYPALYGHYFYLYCEFDGGSYYQDGCYEPLAPNVHCQYPYTNDDPDYGNPKTMSRIKLEEGGTKVVLLDLTENDYLKYDADTLYVDHIYALGDAYGWITRRVDTQSKIDAPYDFRSKTYRRFEVDLSAVNASLGTDYYGQGDDYKGQGTTGNYKDLLSIDWKGYEFANIEIGGQGGADMYWYNGYCDNIVFLGYSFGIKIGNFFYNNTIGKDFQYNTIGSLFYNNTIGDRFYNNTIGNNVGNNTIGNSFNSNTIGNDFNNNTIGNGFILNNIKISVVITNFTSLPATHVYGNYNCEIFKRSDGTSQLSYIDGTNTVQYSAIDA